jgi:hypothetical protein
MSTLILVGLVGLAASFAAAVVSGLLRQRAATGKSADVAEALARSRSGLPTDDAMSSEIAKILRDILREEARSTFWASWFQGFVWFALGSIISFFAADLQRAIQMLWS